MTPQQLPIPNLRDPRHRRPLMTVDAAKGALDRGEDEILEQIGTWLVAWNIAGLDADRRELRILARSVSLAARFLESDEAPQKWDWGEILRIVLPAHDKPWFTGKEIDRTLNCAETHRTNLIRAGVLKVMPGTTWQRGPGGSPCVRRESFIEFLEGRLEDARNIRLATFRRAA